jgi:hypothetical protein
MQRRRGVRIVSENEISAVVLDSAMVVHRTLGPGLLESGLFEGVGT